MLAGLSTPPFDKGTIWSTSYPAGAFLKPMLLRNSFFAEPLLSTLGKPVDLYDSPSLYLVPPTSKEEGLLTLEGWWLDLDEPDERETR